MAFESAAHVRSSWLNSNGGSVDETFITTTCRNRFRVWNDRISFASDETIFVEGIWFFRPARSANREMVRPQLTLVPGRRLLSHWRNHRLQLSTNFGLKTLDSW